MPLLCFPRFYLVTAHHCAIPKNQPGFQLPEGFHLQQGEAATVKRIICNAGRQPRTLTQVVAVGSGYLTAPQMAAVDSDTAPRLSQVRVAAWHL